MTIRVTTGDNAELVAGATWLLQVDATDADGVPVTEDPAVTITLPDDSETVATVEAGAGGGCYLVSHVTTLKGRYVAEIVSGADAVGASAYAAPLTTEGGMPTVGDLDNYLGTHSWSDDDLAEALNAEAAQQRRECRVPAVFPDNLRSALLRRAQFHLAMRRVQLGVIPGDAERDALRPGFDSETRRFEKSHRRLPTG